MGRNAEQRLRDGGVAATRVNPSRSLMVPRDALWFAPPGHPLHDPRSLYPVDEELAADMVARVQGKPPEVAPQEPNHRAILVRDEGLDDATGLQRLHVCDGSQRANASGRAQYTLRKLGVLSRTEALLVRVDFFVGDDAAFLEERIRRNDHDRFTRKDSCSTLAFRVGQLLALGRDAKAIAAVCPKGVGLAEVEALSRWGNLRAQVRARFDAGEAPLGLLGAVLDAVPEQQAVTLDRLLAQGVRTAKGATRAANKAKAERDPWARRMTPQQALRVAKDVATLADGMPKRKVTEVYEQALARGIEYGLRLNAGEAKRVLEELSPGIAATIREARAGKRGGR